MEEPNVRICLLILCSFMIIWPVWDFLIPLESDLNRTPYLRNKTSNGIIDAKELTNFESVTNVTDELIDSSSPSERLRLKIFLNNILQTLQSSHEYSKEEDLRAASAPVGDRTKCRQDLLSVMNQLDISANHRFGKGKTNHELTKYLDSFGKPESGLFSGFVWWVGSYKNCLDSILQLDNKNDLRMRYCWTHWSFKQWHHDGRDLIPPGGEAVATSIRVGACLPETCDTSAIKLDRKSISRLASFEWPEFYKQNLQLDSMFCLPDERSPMRRMPQYGRAYLTIVLCWLCGLLLAAIARRAVAATSKDLQKFELSFVGRLLKATSISSAFSRFKSSEFQIDYKNLRPHQYPRVDLGCLNSQKVFMYILVIFGHAGYMALDYHHSIDQVFESASGSFGNGMMSLTRVVDSFFIISGVFAGYLISQQNLDRTNIFNLWFKFNLRAAIKILPLYYLVYFFVRYVSQYLFAGPWQDYGNDRWSFRGICSAGTWWESTPYWLSNKNTAGFCMPPSWFLLVYLQSSLVIPCIVWILHKMKSEQARLALVMFVSIMSTTLFSGRAYRQTTVRLEAFTTYGALIVNILGKFQPIASYMTFDQIGLITSGCYIGHLLQRYNSKSIQEWPKPLRSLGLFMFVLGMIPIVLFVPLIGMSAARKSNQVTSLAMVIIGYILLKIIWTILNGLLIILCATLYKHTAFVRFFSHTFWHVTSKLGLGLFLIHWEILVIDSTIQDKAPSFGTVSDVMRKFLSSTAMSLMLALPLHVLFEVPAGLLLGEVWQQCEALISRRKNKIN